MLTVDVLKDDLDIAVIVIGAIAAIGTLLAVLVAVADSRGANKRAEKAEREAQIARQETQDLRKLQDERRARAETADLALRGPARVEVEHDLFIPAGPNAMTHLEVTVINGGPDIISDIVTLVDPPVSATPDGTPPDDRVVGRMIQISRGSRSTASKAVWVGPSYDENVGPKITVLFTDHLNNRWRLAPDKSLYLTTPRVLDIDPDPVDEAVFAS